MILSAVAASSCVPPRHRWRRAARRPWRMDLVHGARLAPAPACSRPDQLGGPPNRRHQRRNLRAERLGGARARGRERGNLHRRGAAGSARRRTSLATSAKPRPCLARRAPPSMPATNASVFVCVAMSSTIEIFSPIARIAATASPRGACARFRLSGAARRKVPCFVRIPHARRDRTADAIERARRAGDARHLLLRALGERPAR